MAITNDFYGNFVGTQNIPRYNIKFYNLEPFLNYIRL